MLHSEIGGLWQTGYDLELEDLELERRRVEANFVGLVHRYLMSLSLDFRGSSFAANRGFQAAPSCTQMALA